MLLRVYILACRTANNLRSGFVCSVADEDDKAPLLVLHHHTNGRAWSRGDGQPWRGWELQDPLERWSGVAVEGDRVVGLKLYLCKLMGR